MNNNTTEEWPGWGNYTDTDTGYVEPACVKPDYNLSIHIFVIPAVIIIIVLSFLTKRTNKRGCCRGRPGIPIPVDILSGYENRLTYAMAFGSATYSVVLLFMGQIDDYFRFLYLPGPTWINAFTTIISVLEIGVLEYPILACLSTSWKLTGSIMGFTYVLARSVTSIVVEMDCLDPELESTLPGYKAVVEFPIYICNLFLLGRFFILICTSVRDRFCGNNYFKQSKYEEIKLASESDVSHVKLLLISIINKKEEEVPKLRQKLRNAIYKRQQNFKYPLQIIAAALVAVVVVYEITVLILIYVGRLWKSYKELLAAKEDIVYTSGEEYFNSMAKTLKILTITLLVAIVVSAINFAFHIFHLLKCHREHMLRFFRSQRNFLPESLPSASSLVGLSFRYSGYQVSYMVWAFLILFIVLFALTGGIAAALTILPNYFEIEDLYRSTVGILIGLIPALAITIFLFVLQKILAMFVFRNRSMPDTRITIDNRRLFLAFWFFFFFLNIIVGLVSCILRIIKNMVLGILFLGRLDRSGIVEGFESLDKGYMAYLGFLHVQTTYRNPVILVFLQMLHDGARVHGRKIEEAILMVYRNIKVDVENGLPLQSQKEAPSKSEEEEKKEKECKSKAIRFKWLVAYSLVNNPILLQDRKRNIWLSRKRTEEKISHSVEILPV